MLQSAPPILFSDKARRTHEASISYLIAVAKANPQIISFAAGLVDMVTLPVDEIRDITKQLFNDPKHAREVLQYGTTNGNLPLRQELLKHIEELENKPASSMGISADHIIVTTGSQQSLYILADILINPGDIVIAANPCYFVYTGALQTFGAKVVGVPMDADGMVVDEVEHQLARLERQGLLERVKYIYCTSYFQNPTGLTLSLERRKRLVEIAKKYSKNHRIFILEDAAYRELRYDGQALPSIKSFDETNQYVISSYTFSKPFAPGVKTGYSVMPAELIAAVSHQKGNHDFGSSNLCHHICYEALRTGLYKTHLKTVHEGYRKKRDTMLAAMDKYLPKVDGMSWTHPEGGMYIWLSLPKGFDTSRHGGMFETCLKEGVMYVPGEYCFQPDELGHIPQNHMRLCYGVVPIDQIEPGMIRLANVISAQLQPKHSSLQQPQLT